MVKKPSTVEPATNSLKSVASAMPAMAIVWADTKMEVSLRLLTQSPRGNSRKMPSARAIWLKAGTAPIAAALTPKSSATSAMMGWM